ncbi:Transposase (plasmid) [Roseomonas mucosa]|nr:Transposase [Roseomonas mucosa]
MSGGGSARSEGVCVSFEVAHVDPCRPRAACARLPALCNVPDRCRVGPGRALLAKPCKDRTTPVLADAAGGRCDPLRAPYRLRLGASAPRLPAARDRAPLVPAPLA